MELLVWSFVIVAAGGGAVVVASRRASGAGPTTRDAAGALRRLLIRGRRLWLSIVDQDAPQLRGRLAEIQYEILRELRRRTQATMGGSMVAPAGIRIEVDRSDYELLRAGMDLIRPELWKALSDDGARVSAALAVEPILNEDLHTLELRLEAWLPSQSRTGRTSSPRSARSPRETQRARPADEDTVSFEGVTGGGRDGTTWVDPVDHEPTTVDPPDADPPLRLTDQRGLTYDVYQFPCRVGRAPGMDVRLPYGSVSGFHLVLRRTHGRVEVEAAPDTTNGLSVDGAVATPHEPVAVGDGARLALSGSVTLAVSILHAKQELPA